MSRVDVLISDLKKSAFYAECSCGEEFKLSDAIIFDGLKPFPAEAREAQQQLKEDLKAREDELKKQKKLATVRAENTTKSVNIGQKLESIFPTMKDFKWTLPDCRMMGDPIDLLVFNGFSNNLIKSISFIELKSGKAKMNDHQKAVKDAVDDHRVSYKVIK